jgi:hypothetical protein
MKTFRHFLTISRLIVLKMRNVLGKSCRENENTQFIFNNFFSPENRTLYEIMSKNWVETEGPQMTSQHGAYTLRSGLARLYARMRMRTSTRPGNRTHAQACTHRPVSNTYCSCTAANCFVNALPVLFNIIPKRRY